MPSVRAVMGLLLPASLRAADADRSTDDLALSRFTAVLLLGVYCAYLYFQLKSHIDLFEEEDGEHQHWRLRATRSLNCLACAFSGRRRGGRVHLDAAGGGRMAGHHDCAHFRVF